MCKGKTTKTAIAEFIERVYKSLDDREISGGLFLDLSKAFDLVNHDILLRKMARMGIRGVALKWFQTYLENGTKSGNYVLHIVDVEKLRKALTIYRKRDP